MTTVLDRVTEVQDTIIETIGSVKTPAVNGVSTVVEFIDTRVESLPVLPFGTKVPTPVEFINNQYKFAKAIIDTNKDIALAIAKAAAPITDVLLDRKNVKVAAKRVATKAA
jgi:hypothetical protein